MIKCSHKSSTVEQSPASIFHPKIRVHEKSKVGIPVLDVVKAVVGRGWRATPCWAMACGDVEIQDLLIIDAFRHNIHRLLRYLGSHLTEPHWPMTRAEVGVVRERSLRLFDLTIIQQPAQKLICSFKIETIPVSWRLLSGSDCHLPVRFEESNNTFRRLSRHSRESLLAPRYHPRKPCWGLCIHPTSTSERSE